MLSFELKLQSFKLTQLNINNGLCNNLNALLQYLSTVKHQ